MIRTPAFWTSRNIFALALLPLSLIWAGAAWLRQKSGRGRTVGVPVICVGNLTVGGTGKTPIVAWLYDQLTERGRRPAILSRGYGGSMAGPVWVDGEAHDAAACGDEPLMLAETRDVMVARDRAVGAASIAARGLHDVIIMDDGLQNPHLAKTVSIGVFDGGVGIGNGWLIPAGPLRTRLATGVAMLDLAMMNGADETGLAARLPATLPLHSIKTLIDLSVMDELANTPLLAFAGIGRPARFFASLEAAGGNVVKHLSFADHHAYADHDLVRLQEDAHRLGAGLITTQKDWVRLPQEWRSRVSMLPISIEIDDADGLLDSIETAILPAGRTGSVHE